jgi:ligand-binding SRPBCC domain-containing protein
MGHFEKKSLIPCSAQSLYRWHLSKGAFETLTPPWGKVSVVSRPEVLEEGAEVELRIRIGPIPLTWIASHVNFEEGLRFDDIQVSGPFREWRHFHLFEPVSENGCYMFDSIQFQLFAGAVLNRIAEGFVLRRLDTMFDYRHQRLLSLFGPGGEIEM